MSSPAKRLWRKKNGTFVEKKDVRDSNMKFLAFTAMATILFNPASTQSQKRAAENVFQSLVVDADKQQDSEAQKKQEPKESPKTPKAAPKKPKAAPKAPKKPKSVPVRNEESDDSEPEGKKKRKTPAIPKKALKKKAAVSKEEESE